MHFPGSWPAVLLQLLTLTLAAQAPSWKRPGMVPRRQQLGGRSDDGYRVLAPKLFILNMYDSEGDTWTSKKALDLFANNVTVPGLSPLFPDAHCDSAGDLCELTTGEGEINAASSVMALAFSSQFDLRKTYFMIAGNAGVNPECGTSGSVAFSRYAVQVALQYEIDPRELPDNFTTGYIPLGAYAPGEYPEYIYGTEVFELNKALRDRAVSLGQKATLKDNEGSQKYRAKYPASQPGSKPPNVFAGDTATSDNWFSGALLGDAFANFTTLVTNGTGRYCMTAQEDNGSLEALLRADLAGRVDFSRIMLMRTASDFDRPPPHISVIQNLLYLDYAPLELSLENMYQAGIEIVNDIKKNWASVYEKGVKPENYIGDIFDSLHGPIPPDFGLPADYGNGSIS